MSSSDAFPSDIRAELMSRLRTFRSNTLALKATYWAAYKKTRDKHQTATVLYPTLAFRQLEKYAREIELKINSLVADSGFPLGLRDLRQSLDTAFVELMGLQYSLSQRVSGTNIMRVPEYNPPSGVEGGWVLKAFNAIDALSFDLISRMLGSKRVKDVAYVPTSVFGTQGVEKGYHVYRQSYVVNVPVYDAFRSRFWSIMAHEMSHVAIDVFVEEGRSIEYVLLDGVSFILELFGYEHEDRIGRRYATRQIVELACDIMGASVCPSTLITGAEMFNLPVEEPDTSFRLNAQLDTHPPSDARLAAMARVTQTIGIPQVDGYFRSFTDSLFSFCNAKNLCFSNDSFELLDEYIGFAEEFADILLQEIRVEGVNICTKKNWEKVIRLLETGNLQEIRELPPVEAISLPWIKRFGVTRISSEDSYISDREKETKTWDLCVETMDKYYQSVIVQSVEEEDVFNIRINTD